MTEEQKQEQISRFFAGAIVAHAGHVFQFGANDVGGVDASIRKTLRYDRKKGERILFSGNSVDVQLKSTTERGITRTINKDGDPIIAFDLEAKNYNDLIVRKKLRAVNEMNPLVLFLIVFPEDRNDWISLNFDNHSAGNELVLNGAAYWFYPEGDLPVVENIRTKRIFISPKNIVDLNILESLENHSSLWK